MSKGFDTTSDCTSFGQAIKDSGYSFVCRYYHSLSHSVKQKLTRTEALHLSSMGIFLVAVFENAGDHAGYFSSQQGLKDGTNAGDYAHSAIQQPKPAPIYFAVDYDASHHELDAKIIPYFHGVNAALDARGYAVGVYGSGLVCRRLKELGLVSYTWVAQSPGWSETATYDKWNLKQHMPTKFHGLDIDPNDSNGNGGGFLVK